MDVEMQVPSQGEHGDISDIELPISALRLSQNVFRNEEGILAIRPGYKALNPVHPGGRIMGIGYFKSAGGQDRQIAANQNQVWQYNGTNWVVIGVTLTGGTADHVRFTTMPVAGVYNTIITNSVNTPKIWNGSNATYQDLGGNPGVAIDSTVCANRLCLLQAPNRVKISDFNNPNIWPVGAGFNVDLIDAGDLMVGMESLNRTAIAILGEESQWVGRAQSGANPMRFERISEESGPMSAAVTVNLGSVIYYLSTDYNVYRFDGVNCQPVGWAMKPWIQANINLGNKNMSHGAYFDKIGKIFWWFAAGTSQAPNYGIHLDPKTGEMGRLVYSNRYITASGRVRIIVSVTWGDLQAAGLTWKTITTVYPTWGAMGDSASERRIALGTLDGQVHIAGTGDGSDASTAVEGIFESPLKPYAGWPKAQTPSTFETFFRQTINPTIVELSLGYTDTLMGALEYKLIDTFDLSKIQRNDIDLTAVQEKRFVTIRHRVSALTGGVAWTGGVYNFEAAEINRGPTGDNT